MQGYLGCFVHCSSFYFLKKISFKLFKSFPFAPLRLCVKSTPLLFCILCVKRRKLLPDGTKNNHRRQESC